MSFNPLFIKTVPLLNVHSQPNPTLRHNKLYHEESRNKFSSEIDMIITHLGFRSFVLYTVCVCASENIRKIGLTGTVYNIIASKNNVVFI